MKTAPLTASLVALTAGLAAATGSAHHSWSAEYDLSRTTLVSGTIARVLIRNPHSALVVNVGGRDGRREQWTVEWGSPQRLRDRGVTEATLRVGESLVVTGNPHRDDDVRSVRAVSVRRADGTEVGGNTPGNDRPRPGVPSSTRR